MPEPRVHIEFDDAEPVLSRTDALIANFEEPDELLKQKVLFAHSLGKSVLVGINIRLDPEEVLSEIAKPPYLSLEKRPSRAYYIYGEDKKHAI